MSSGDRLKNLEPSPPGPRHDASEGAAHPGLSSAPRRSLTKALVPAAKLTVAATLIVLLVRGGQLDLSHLASVHSVPAVLLGIGAVFLGFAASTVRWHGILRSFGVGVSRRECFRISWLGLLGSQVLPGVTGGDLVRGASIARALPSRRLPAVFSVVIDRGIGLVGLLMIGTVALTLAPAELREDPLLATVTRSVALLCALGCAGLLAITSRRAWRVGPVAALADRVPETSAAGRLLAALRLLEGKRGAVVIALAWSLFAHAMTVTACYVVARGNLEGSAGFLDTALLVPVGQLAAALPISPGGVGVSEWVYEGMFARLGAPYGAELSLWLRLLTITVSLGALPWLVRHRTPATASRRAASPTS